MKPGAERITASARSWCASSAAAPVPRPISAWRRASCQRAAGWPSPAPISSASLVGCGGSQTAPTGAAAAQRAERGPRPAAAATACLEDAPSSHASSRHGPLLRSGRRRIPEAAGRPARGVAFSGDGLDAGTALLIEHLHAGPTGGLVVDQGCGAGHLGIAALRAHDHARALLVDADVRVRCAQREANLAGDRPGAPARRRAVVGCPGGGAGDRRGPGGDEPAGP